MILFVLVLVDNELHTKQIHAACYKVVGSSPAAAKFFIISVFNFGIANGAKVCLKLRLSSAFLKMKIPYS